MLKRLLISSFILFSCGCANAFEVNFEPYREDCKAVIAVIGTSYLHAKASDNSPFVGGYLMGGAYRDTVSELHDAGFCVVTGAQGGAVSFDNLGWLGYSSQADNVLMWSMWSPAAGLPAESTIDVVVIDTLVNDCWASIDPRFPCNDIDMDETVQNVVNVALLFANNGTCTIVLDRPREESLHIEEGFAYYGLASDIVAYSELSAKFIGAFDNLDNENIHYVKSRIYHGEYADGIHPLQEDQERDAKRIRKAIRRHCQ